MANINHYAAQSGRMLKEDGTTVNFADKLESGLPVESSAQGAILVVPNDSTDLTTTPTKGIYIGGTGDLKVTMLDGTTVTFKSISAGAIHPLSVKRVFATGTTATNILAVY
ncbi:spike base protein, RCAP_Rcc01079 family [Peribacillus sp. JNUCC 23]